LGMEVNSHKLGLIQETVIAFEVVLSDGTLIRASKTENVDLYYALPWSHGTIGFLVAVEVEIIPVKPYMKLTYIPCHTLDEFATKMHKMSVADDSPSFLEATIYSKDKAVIMAGEFSDVTTAEQRAKINSVNYWFKPWFYKHVEKFLKKGEAEEYIPLRHYYHRHTRSIFWELEDMVPFGNHPVYRWLFGWLGAPKIAFLKLSMTKQIRQETILKHVVQDIIIPIEEIKASVEKFEKWFNIYPLLFYPIRIYDNGKYQGFLRKPENPEKGKNWQMFYDLGAYGVPLAVKKNESYDAIAMVREMERYTRDVKGYQCLYADTFMTREEFEDMFDHTHYRKMREKYHAVGAFPEVYDKVKVQWHQ